MADERWQKVREIFDAALRQPPEVRQNYLVEACGEDAALLGEVESLFSSYDKSEDFLAQPAVAVVADIIEVESKRHKSGQRFGHYEITEHLGAGGMGEVYLAQDTKLDRQVAVKFLNDKHSDDPANLARFVREAKAASALNHPNILVIHEIGDTEEAHYIVSEYVTGETLRRVLADKTLPLTEVLDIASQVASALTAAHEARLVHRDIKPENVMLRPDGLVKVLDFGLAKLVEQKNKSLLGLGDSTAQQSQTAKGMILGTVNYMSPEQAKGERIDERTDIFSFGVLLYEMLAGQTPFAGNSVLETLANVINAEPPPLARFVRNVPDELQRLVAKTLCKDRDARYQTMKGLLADLKELRGNLAAEAQLERGPAASSPHATTVLQEAATGDLQKQTIGTKYSFWQQIKRHQSLVTFALIALLIGALGFGYYFFANRGNTKPIESIAVLPLENLSGDTSQDYFADGMTDAVITELAKIGNLRVISRNSTAQYKDTRKKISELASELNVEAVVVGTVLRSGDKVRISLQMFRASDDQNIWSNSYERDIRDVLALQNQVSRGIVSEIKVKLTPEDKANLSRQTSVKPEAQDALFRGRYYFYQAVNNVTSNDERKKIFQKSFDAFQQAISIEPNYAEAYAALATSYHWSVPDYPGSETFPKSIEAANRAIQIDETNALAHQALGYSTWNYKGDAVTAEKEFKRAIELDPNEEQGHGGYALLLSAQGSHDEAIREMKLAVDADPLNLYLKYIVAQIYGNARQYDKAIEQCRYVITLNPTQTDYRKGLAYYLTYQGMYQEALAEMQKVSEMNKMPTESSLNLAWIYAMAGRRKEAIKIINEDRKQPEEKQNPLRIAEIYAALGDKDQAIHWLEKAIALGKGGLRWLKIVPEFDSLRDDPRFDELVRRVGLK